ncbi:MAG: cbb3-type cytochrome oxidase assembly protein CcoS [Proteobacteria bacterium]|nr:cbb3-type cytochrome oxidase assembly protein CcoS [Pseudomonadota bacterium]
MEVIFILIIVSLLFIALIAVALYWSIHSGQFDDLEGHGHQILMDDDTIDSDDKKESSQ